MPEDYKRSSEAQTVWRKQRLEEYLRIQDELLRGLRKSFEVESDDAYEDNYWERLLEALQEVHAALLKDLASPLNL